jgi:hypothetical protein
LSLHVLPNYFLKFKLGIFSKISEVICVVIGKGKGKGKVKVHPIAGHEGPEA